MWQTLLCLAILSIHPTLCDSAGSDDQKLILDPPKEADSETEKSTSADSSEAFETDESEELLLTGQSAVNGFFNIGATAMDLIRESEILDADVKEALIADEKVIASAKVQGKRKKKNDSSILKRQRRPVGSPNYSMELRVFKIAVGNEENVIKGPKRKDDDENYWSFLALFVETGGLLSKVGGSMYDREVDDGVAPFYFYLKVVEDDYKGRPFYICMNSNAVDCPDLELPGTIDLLDAEARKDVVCAREHMGSEGVRGVSQELSISIAHWQLILDIIIQLLVLLPADSFEQTHRRDVARHSEKVGERAGFAGNTDRGEGPAKTVTIEEPHREEVLAEQHRLAGTDKGDADRERRIRSEDRHFDRKLEEGSRAKHRAKRRLTEKPRKKHGKNAKNRGDGRYSTSKQQKQQKARKGGAEDSKNADPNGQQASSWSTSLVNKLTNNREQKVEKKDKKEKRAKKPSTTQRVLGYITSRKM